MSDPIARLAAGEPRRPRRRRWLVALVVALVALVGVAGSVYAGLGWYAWDQLSRVPAGCGDRAFGTQTPADFKLYVGREIDGRTVDVELTTPDVAPYRFTGYQDVAFPARGGGPMLQAWYAPGSGGTAGPTVILVHGRASCRRDPNILLPAGMLHRAGFGVLMLDLRNHGDSAVDDGRWAGGAKEYLDVLGAWDWLIARGQTPARIGLLGESLGAATAAIATGQEDLVAASWLDSSYADVMVAMREFATGNGYPWWVADAATQMAGVLGEPALGRFSPDEEMAKLDGRPIRIVHGLADTTIAPHHAIDLAQAAAAGGTPVEPWLVPGARHTEAMFFVTDRYQAALVAFFAGTIGAA